MDHRSIGLLVAALGAVAIVVGLLIASGLLSWFGRLPGDINIKTDNVRVYVPLASMIVISIALSLLLYLVRRLF